MIEKPAVIVGVLYSYLLLTVRRDWRTSVNLDDGYPGFEYDFVVVGGGTAGCVVAARLAETYRWSVLVLETGSEESVTTYIPSATLSPESLHQYSTEPQTHALLGIQNQSGLLLGGRVIGGSSAISGTTYVRGSPEDFDLWSRLGNPGWSYDDVLPFFWRSEDQRNNDFKKSVFHGTGGPVPVSDPQYVSQATKSFLKAGKELGYKVGDINGYIRTGFTNPQKMIEDGIRISSATAYLREMSSNHNIHVSLNTTAYKVLLDSTRRAIGVVFERGGKMRTVLARKEVIVSAGVIESPKLLLLSGIGPPYHLHHVGVHPIIDLPGVGHNLHTQVSVYPLIWTVNMMTGISIWDAANPLALPEYIISGTGFLAKEQENDGLALVNVDTFKRQWSHWPDLGVKLMSKHAAYGSTERLEQLLQLRKDNLEAFNPLRMSEGITLMPILQRPWSRGLVKLKSKNATIAPLIDPRLLTHPYDLHILVEGIRFCMKLAKTASLKKIGAKMAKVVIPRCRRYRRWSRGYLECVIRHVATPYYNRGGTCKMGPLEDQEAVVDPELRVYGTTGLRVIDASIFPTPIVGDAQATVYMVAEKGAHLIRTYWH